MFQLSKRKKIVVLSAFIIYIVLIIYITIISREPTETYRIHWIPFWSYYRIIVRHHYNLIFEAVANYFLLMPFGCFIATLIKKISVKSFTLLAIIVSLSCQ